MQLYSLKPIELTSDNISMLNNIILVWQISLFTCWPPGLLKV